MKRILMYFTEYRKSGKVANKYLEGLQDDEELNFDYCEIFCNGNNPISEKYNIKKIPTYVLLEKIVGKDLYKEVNRIEGKVSNAKLLVFLTEKGEE